MIPERLIIFSAGGEQFACNLQEIAEVMEPQESFPIAGAPPHYQGVINFHGNLIALVDLARYLGLESRAAFGKLLVVDPRLAHLALKVDAVNSITGSEALTGEVPGEDPLTEALLETPFGSARLIRLEALLSGLEKGLRQASSPSQP